MINLRWQTTRDVIQAFAMTPIPEQSKGAKLRTVEALLGCTGVLVGLWILMPWWSTFESVQTYSPLVASDIPEWAWGLMFVGAGMLRLAALMWGGNRAKVAGAIAISFLWLTLFIVVLMGNPGGLGPPLFGALTAYSLVSLYRISARR